MITGVNHITLAVTDLERSLSFYVDLLGCELRHRWSQGAYLEAGDLWLCLSLDPARQTRPSDDYSHVAFSVEEGAFDAFATMIEGSKVSIWKNNQSEGDSIYFLDPDGHKLEVHVGTLNSRLQSFSHRGEEQ